MDVARGARRGDDVTSAKSASCPACLSAKLLSGLEIPTGRPLMYNLDADRIGAVQGGFAVLPCASRLSRHALRWLQDLKPIPSADAIAPLKFGKYLGRLDHNRIA